MDILDKQNESRLSNLYYKKTVVAKWAGKVVTFDIPVTGFSSYQLDHGTLRLLRQFELDKHRWDHVLDLGCGYGPIAVYLSITGLAATITGIDRDALSVAFAKRNAEKNAVNNCEFIGGLAYVDLSQEKKYDAIISNIPAKAGLPVHQEMLLGASQYLKPGGEVRIVVVAPLEARIDEILTNKAIGITSKIVMGEHIVYGYKFLNVLPLSQGTYSRTTSQFSWQKYNYGIDTAFGLPEFDSLSWETEMLFKFINEKKDKLSFDKIVVCEPGQGHIPVFLHHLTKTVKETILVSRDALSLRQNIQNLKKNNFEGRISQYHSILFWNTEIGTDIGLCLCVLNDKEGLDINCEKIAVFRSGCKDTTMIMACPVSFGIRMEKALCKRGIRASLVSRYKGRCIIQSK